MAPIASSKLPVPRLPVLAALLAALVAGMSLGPRDKGGDPGSHPAQEVERDEAEIRALLEDQYAALLAMDADRYASHLRADAIWENALGDRYVGRDEVRDFNARVAATMEGARYEGWDARVVFVTPEVAVADVSATLIGQQVGGRVLVDRPMLNVYVLRKEAGTWSIAHTRIRDRWALAYKDS